MPIGYLVPVILIAWCTVFALAPLRRQGFLGAVGFRSGLAVNELPFTAFLLLLVPTLVALTQGDLDPTGGRAVLGLAVATAGGLAVVARRALRSGAAVGRALDAGLGAGGRTAADPGRAARPRRRPLVRILFWPFPVRPRGVRRVRDIAYGGAGKRNRLDVYHHRSRPSGAPTLIYLHGGGYFSGHKNREARPLLHRLAGQGWVCVSANYRLRPAAGFPDHVIDAKKVIAWARGHGREYGADPSVLFAAGSSAGGHLVSLAGLTPNDPVFQPGFEGADTSVTGVISLYGFYGHYYDHGDHPDWPPSSPADHAGPGAPPFFMAHGDRDSLVPVRDARRFADALRAVSSDPVVYAELPGGQHAFDLFRSVRFEAVVDGIEAFTAWVRSREEARRK